VGARGIVWPRERELQDMCDRQGLWIDDSRSSPPGVDLKWPAPPVPAAPR